MSDLRDRISERRTLSTRLAPDEIGRRLAPWASASMTYPVRHTIGPWRMWLHVTGKGIALSATRGRAPFATSVMGSALWTVAAADERTRLDVALAAQRPLRVVLGALMTAALAAIVTFAVSVVLGGIVLLAGIVALAVITLRLSGSDPASQADRDFWFAWLRDTLQAEELDAAVDAG